MNSSFWSQKQGGKKTKPPRQSSICIPCVGLFCHYLERVHAENHEIILNSLSHTWQITTAVSPTLHSLHTYSKAFECGRWKTGNHVPVDPTSTKLEVFPLLLPWGPSLLPFFKLPTLPSSSLPVRNLHSLWLRKPKPSEKNLHQIPFSNLPLTSIVP